MKPPPPQTFTRDLSVHPTDGPGDRLARVAATHSLPGTGKTHGDPVHVEAVEYVPTAEDVARVAAKRMASLARLTPKKKSKGGSRA